MSSSVDFGTNTNNYYYTYPNVFNWTTEDWTIALWFRTANGIANRNAVYMTTATTNNTPIYLVSTGNKIRCIFDGTVIFGQKIDITSSAAVSIDTWYFAAVTHDVSAKTMELFTNATDLNVLASEGTGTYTTSTSTADEIILGRQLTSGWAWYGYMSQFHAYTRPLALGELQEIMFKPYSITNGCVIYDPMYSSLATSPDLSGNGNDGVETGTLADSSLGPPVYFQQMQG